MATQVEYGGGGGGSYCIVENWKLLFRVEGLGCSPSQVDRIWNCVYYNEISIYPIFYLLKGTTGS